MSDESTRLIQQQLRSPRSAAFAGILFSLLISASLVLLYNLVNADPAEIDSEWLETWSGTVSLVLIMVPFAGIAFLWFTGVVRDRIGDLEDRFFATIYLGSSIIIVVMIFIWAAIIGAIFGTYTTATALSLDDDIIVFGFRLMNEIVGNYVVRMAGVYMLSIGSLWTRTGTMPRWLTIATYIVALGFIFFAGSVKEARFIFPAWVFVVSVYILILNYGHSGDKSSEANS
jgi:hypothetical protein